MLTINRVKSACTQCSRTTRSASEWHTAMLGLAKRLVLKPAQSRSSSKPTRRMLSLVGTLRLDPKQATFREQEMLPLSPAEPFPRTFPRKYKWSSFLPFPFPHLMPPSHGNLSEYFDSYRQKSHPDSCQGNESHVSTKPMLQTSWWGVTIPKPLKNGSSAVYGRNSRSP